MDQDIQMSEASLQDSAYTAYHWRFDSDQVRRNGQTTHFDAMPQGREITMTEDQAEIQPHRDRVRHSPERLEHHQVEDATHDSDIDLLTEEASFDPVSVNYAGLWTIQGGLLSDNNLYPSEMQLEEDDMTMFEEQDWLDTAEPMMTDVAVSSASASARQPSDAQRETAVKARRRSRRHLALARTLTPSRQREPVFRSAQEKGSLASYRAFRASRTVPDNSGRP